MASFGDEWSRFDQTALSPQELDKAFAEYFSAFPWDELPEHATGIDIGCGSGRWAERVASRVGHLHCLDASDEALDVARRRLAGFGNVSFHHAGASEIPLANNSLDFAYSLGVLHHVPDTEEALRASAMKLKVNAPFLVYLYYNMDNRPKWFRFLWRLSDSIRKGISRLPPISKSLTTDLIALVVYWPLSRFSRLLEVAGINPEAIPLAYYRKHSLYTLRTDARDRFGTPVEHRFSLVEIIAMMEKSGLDRIEHRMAPPYWCVVGRRRSCGAT